MVGERGPPRNAFGDFAHLARIIWSDPIFAIWPWATSKAQGWGPHYPHLAPPRNAPNMSEYSIARKDAGALHPSNQQLPLREYDLARSLSGVMGLLASVQNPSEGFGALDEGRDRVIVQIHGDSVELQHRNPAELYSGDQARLRLHVSLVPIGNQTRAALRIEQPCFLEAMLRGDIVPEAVGWCAAIAISLFQGLIGSSVEAAFVSFGISALGLLGVRLGTAYALWRRAKLRVREDLGALLELVHAQLAPEAKSSVMRY